MTKELIKSVSISKLTRDVNKIQNMHGAEFEWYRAGIRPQLYCSKERKLINDFVWYNTKDSLHLLNVVSPGWTCAMPFADAVVSDIVLKV